MPNIISCRKRFFQGGKTIPICIFCQSIPFKERFLCLGISAIKNLQARLTDHNHYSNTTKVQFLDILKNNLKFVKIDLMIIYYRQGMS